MPDTTSLGRKCRHRCVQMSKVEQSRHFSAQILLVVKFSILPPHPLYRNCALAKQGTILSNILNDPYNLLSGVGGTNNV